MTRRSARAAAVVSFFALGACTGDGGPRISVTATDTECRPARTDIDPGKVRFVVTNKGTTVTELYIYSRADKVEGEVENIGPGTTRTLSANLSSGRYQLACKPGQRGDGIRTDIDVVAKGNKAPSGADAGTTPDLVVPVTAKDFAFSGLESFAPVQGRSVAFVLGNQGQALHDLQIVDPKGDAMANLSEVQNGHTSMATVRFAVAGRYTYKCTIDGHADLGMKGTITVANR